MTERWQKQLRKLREIEPPADGWQRAETRDPSGDGLPPPRQRIAAGIVAFGVFAAAGAFGWTAFRPTGLNTSVGEDPGPALIVSIRAPADEVDPDRLMLQGGPKPSIDLAFGEARHDGFIVGYTWCVQDGQDCGGALADYDLSSFLRVPVGTDVVVEGDALRADGTFDLWGEKGPAMPIEAGVPQDPGSYLLSVDASFPQGDVTFAVGVKAIPQAEIPEVESLSGTEWRITTIDGVALDEDVDGRWGASIAFRDEVLSGWSGCNSFGGPYQIDGSTLTVGGIERTEVGCDASEAALFERLETADRWASDGETLAISGSAGSITAVRVGFEPVDVLHIECLPGETQILDPEVVATADGINARLGPVGHAKHVVFLSTEGEIVSMVGLDDRTKDATVPLAPGSWSVRCTGWGDDISPEEVTVLARDAGSDDDSASNDLRSTYVFSDIEAGPSTAEPQDLAVSFTVAWSGGAYPGVHRCGYRALATDGSVVGELVHLAAWRPGRWYHDVPGDPDAAVRGEVWCEPDRLDDPGIADVEPISIDGDLAVEDLEREYDERLESWAAQFSVRSMSEVRLAGNMWAVDLAWGEAEDFTVSRQLADRRHYLCVRLPPGHAYRGGEFCE